MTGLASVTIDSSLMYPTTSRRFLMALWEMEGLRINLVPKAVQEMYGYVQESEREYWHERLDKESERTGRAWAPEIAEAIARAAEQGAADWVNDELGYGQKAGREDSMLRATALDAGQSVRAAGIARSIPRECFKGATKNDYRGDREIIGQGVAAGYKILASDNRGSIRRNAMNGWLMETGHANAEFILNADDAIDRAGQWREQPQHMLEAVLRATLPGQRRTAQREDEILGQFTAHADAGVEERRAKLLERLVRPEPEENLRRGTHVHRQQRDTRERHRGAAKDAHAQGGANRGIRAVNESTDLFSGPPSAGTLHSTCRPRTAIRLWSPHARMGRWQPSSRGRAPEHVPVHEDEP